MVDNEEGRGGGYMIFGDDMSMGKAVRGVGGSLGMC
jgi:hypothetical protein